MSMSARASSAPPIGTVTFLFSDIEGSTRLLDVLGDGYADVLGRHRTALRQAFVEHGGVERGTEGDSFFVAFPEAAGGLAAAAAGTRNLAAIDWPNGAEVRVRIGLHTGEGRLVDGDYVGMDVHRAARIAAAAHGGQVLLSESTRILAERDLPGGASLRDMGEHRLKDLPAAEHLYQLVVDGQPSDFPPIRSMARSVANLPAQLSSIIGREREVGEVRDLVARIRLVTVTGPGGTGKTRLVQEVARKVVADDAADVAFVPLDTLTDPDRIPTEVLRALGLDVAAARDPVDRLIEHLVARRTLLVLDNLEQIPEAGVLVRSILDRAPTASILVSSQAPLHVAGEQEYALGPLDVATTAGGDGADGEGIASSPAMGLFVERARAVRADFELNASNAEAVREICARLAGLPLAIELAGAQVKLLSPVAILERLERSLDTLTSRRDDLPDRHRTLRATVAWSYDLLGDADQRLFRRLAAFAGGALLSEIEAIGAVDPRVPDAVDALGTLVDRSLVTVRRGVAGDDRFSLFETMRSYGRELLREQGEEALVAASHADIYRDLARQAEPEYYGPARRAWVDRIAAEHSNLRAALHTLQAEGRLADALELAADLWRFWQQRGHMREGMERLDELLAAAAAPGAAAVPAATLSRAEEAAGGLRYWLYPDRTIAEPFYERSLAHAIESGDRHREAWARHNYAFVFDFTSAGAGHPNLQRAGELRERALQMFRDAGDRRGIAESLWAMGGNATAASRDAALARSHLTEAIPILEELGDLFGLGWAYISLGLIDLQEGNRSDAEQRLLAAADVFARDGDTTGEVIAVQALGAFAAKGGDVVTAVRFNAAALAAAAAIGVEAPGIPPITAPLKEAEAQLAPEDLEREQGIGRALGAQAILSTAIESSRAGRRGVATGP
jgi:predicted ATPase/class 3 adenylate cyclase